MIGKTLSTVLVLEKIYESSKTQGRQIQSNRERLNAETHYLFVVLKMHLSFNNCINYRFSLRNHKISSKIWDQLARVNCSKANKIARARKASEICLPWKIYECLPLCCCWISQGFPARGCFEL